MIDRRKFQRISSSIRVEMIHASMGMITGYTSDISDGGARVLIENQPLFPVGTELNVLFRKVAGPVNVDPVKMKVVRIEKNSMGLMFVS